jgi:hypothetical protein
MAGEMPSDIAGLSNTEALKTLVRERRTRPARVLRRWIEDFWPSFPAPLKWLASESGVDDLVDFFRCAGYPLPGTAPDHELTIWRGEPAGDARRGLSWFEGRKDGERYAEDYRNTGSAVLWRAIAPPDAFLARFVIPSQNRVETVVDPSRIRDETIVCTLPGREPLYFDVGLPWQAP